MPRENTKLSRFTWQGHKLSLAFEDRGLSAYNIDMNGCHL
jgi:hypothetical protein